jgi:signal transduction histidine kinase
VARSGSSLTRLDGLLDRLYARMGANYLRLFGVLGVAITLLLACAAVLVIAKYLDYSADEALLAIALVEAATVLALLVGWYLSERYERPVLRWLDADAKSAPTRELWELTLAGPRRVVLLVGTSGALIACLPGAVVHASIADLSFWQAVLILAAALTMVVYVSVLVYFVGEMGVRPLLRDMAARMGEDARVPTSGTGVARKILTGLLAFGFLSGMLSIFLIEDRGAGPEGIGKALLAALFVGTTFSLAIATIFSQAVLAPVRDLMKGTRDLAAGNLDAHVPALYDDEFGELAQSFNDMVAELRRQAEEVRASQARIVASADAERRRMERDLHDGAQQHLVLLKMKLGVLEDAIERDPAAAKAKSAELKGDLGRALAELRDLAHGIYPSILEHDGLPAALRDAAERSPLTATVESNGAGRYPSEVEAAVYFCCLEALQNAAKHAGEGATARISLSQENGELRFEVSDDGAGFDAEGTAASAGLQNMTDRIGALGGELQVRSAQGEGTKVVGQVPVVAVGLGEKDERA